MSIILDRHDERKQSNTTTNIYIYILVAKILKLKLQDDVDFGKLGQTKFFNRKMMKIKNDYSLDNCWMMAQKL